MTNLPDWIKWDKDKGKYVILSWYEQWLIKKGYEKGKEPLLDKYR